MSTLRRSPEPASGASHDHGPVVRRHGAPSHTIQAAVCSAGAFVFAKKKINLSLPTLVRGLVSRMEQDRDLETWSVTDRQLQQVNQPETLPLESDATQVHDNLDADQSNEAADTEIKDRQVHPSQRHR